MNTEQQDKKQKPVLKNLSTDTDKIAEKKTVTDEVQKTDKKNDKENKKEKIATNKTIYPDVVPGATVRVHQKIKEKKGKETKERIQVFEGIVLARKHGNELGATITVKKIAKGNFGVEKIYPLHSPLIAKIEIIKQAIVRRSKLGFLRTTKKKLKTK